MTRTRPKIYVVHAQIDQRQIDVSPAEEYGDLVYMFRGKNIPSTDRVVNLLYEWLADYDGTWDIILPLGRPDLIALAASVATDISGGPIQLLVWDRKSFVYKLVSANVCGLEQVE